MQDELCEENNVKTPNTHGTTQSNRIGRRRSVPTGPPLVRQRGLSGEGMNVSCGAVPSSLIDLHHHQGVRDAEIQPPIPAPNGAQIVGMRAPSVPFNEPHLRTTSASSLPGLRNSCTCANGLSSFINMNIYQFISPLQ